jgi:hypothetical protein
MKLATGQDPSSFHMDYLKLKEHYHHGMIVELTMIKGLATGIEIRCTCCDEQLVWYPRPKVNLRAKNDTN